MQNSHTLGRKGELKVRTKSIQLVLWGGGRGKRGWERVPGSEKSLRGEVLQFYARQNWEVELSLA